MPHRASEPALQAYLNAIQKIGKGTGKRAVRYRQDAREAACGGDRGSALLDHAALPRVRIAARPPRLLRSGHHRRGVTIRLVGATGIAARAKSCSSWATTAGISEGVGLEEQKIKTLMQRFLSEQVPVYPRADVSRSAPSTILPRSCSPAVAVMLKEHFRCVAPIIEYSKREFYQHELRPLRLPKTSERLDPPLVDIFIEDAQRKDDVNLAEIDFIVGEVRRLALDPRTAGRSIGVVSLLGDEQALKAWDRLNDELGPELLSAIKSRAATRALSRAGSVTSCSCPWSRHPTRSVRRYPETSSRRDSTLPRLAPAIGCISYAR
jgi:hypothetical protein